MERWVLSQFYTNDNGMTVPVVGDYFPRWVSCRNPEVTGGSTLVKVFDATPQQIAAIGQDSRMVVCPALGSLTAPAAAITAYAGWTGVSAGLSMDGFLAALAETEPNYLMV